jgi:hypothetical protein
MSYLHPVHSTSAPSSTKHPAFCLIMHKRCIKLPISLLRPPDLSAIKIDVDTKSGRVALHGSAPSVAARERATMIALGVKGVAGVDNRLTIKSAS